MINYQPAEGGPSQISPSTNNRKLNVVVSSTVMQGVAQGSFAGIYHGGAYPGKLEDIAGIYFENVPRCSSFYRVLVIYKWPLMRKKHWSPVDSPHNGCYHSITSSRKESFVNENTWTEHSSLLSSSSWFMTGPLLSGSPAVCHSLDMHLRGIRLLSAAISLWR